MAMVSGEVLIVDDTPENLQVLGAILRNEGLTVRLATSGAHALRSVGVRKPDLILLDIRMPGLDGLETCRRLKADPQTAAIPVLFISASQEHEERLGAFATGGVDFILKPFHAPEALARITTHLTLARLQRELIAANARLAVQVEVESQQRVDAEQLAHDRQVRLELALAAAGMGTWSSDILGSHLDLDDASRALLGCEVADLAALTAGFAARDQPGLLAGWQDGLREGRPFEYEGWWQTGSAPRRLRLRGCVPRDGQAVVGLLWDVTADYAVRNRLAQSEKLESLGQLAGGVAHDFNNHLAIIVGNLDLLRRSVTHDPKAVQRLGQIDAAAMCASALVRELLTFARRREVAMEPMLLAPVVTDLAAMLGGLLGRQITLDLADVDASVRVTGCREQLQNALLNLCVNARDAMDGRGRLRLSVTREVVAGECCRISGCQLSGVFGAISVSDTGSGIPPDIQQRIFEPFFTTKPEGKGTGLGLPTVVGCVTAHGGHLLLRSEPGKGTTFIMLLPLVAGMEPGPAA